MKDYNGFFFMIFSESEKYTWFSLGNVHEQIQSGLKPSDIQHLNSFLSWAHLTTFDNN